MALLLPWAMKNLRDGSIGLLLAASLVLGPGCDRPRATPGPSASASAAPPPGAPPAAPRGRVVLISIDGLSAAYLDRPRPEQARIPTLMRLRREGVFAPLRSVWPTQTYPAHTTLLTGASPARHGIVANVPFDPFRSLGGAWYFQHSDIKADTLWKAALRAGLSTGNAYWPVTVGAPVTWSFPQYWNTRGQEDIPRLYEMTTPGLRDEFMEKFHTLPSESGTDRERADAGLHILATRAPALTLIYLTDLDTISHKEGPMSEKSWETLASLDRDLARLLEAAQKPGPVTLFVVSDHGFSSVSRAFQPNVALRAAGLLQADAQGNLTSYRAAVHRGGAVCAIRLAPGEGPQARDLARRALESAAKNPENGIAAVLDGAEIEKQGGFPGAALVLLPRPGFECGGAAQGKLVRPADHAGTHGYPPTDPEMLATLLIGGHRARSGATLPVVDMRDVAPTVAHLLGLALHDAEGRPLLEALAP